MKRPEVNLETWPAPEELSAVIDKAHELRAQEMKRIFVVIVDACRSQLKRAVSAISNLLRDTPSRNPA